MGATQGTGRGGFDRTLTTISAVVVLGSIMSILDTTIVNVAIDSLARDFHTSLATIQWVSTGYMLALATVIPLTGWAADRFGTKRLYIISIVLFLAGSALSGAAWSAGSLIGFRVLQGLGGGMIMPAGMTILTHAAGPRRVGRVMSVVGVPMMLGPIVGPILGGWLVDDISWRWIFYVNLPIGGLALVAALRFLPRDEPQPTQRLDLLGLAMLSPGLAAFVYGLAETTSSGGFGSAKAVVPMAIGLALIATFVWHSLRTETPLIDVRLFRNRTVTAAALTTFLFGTAFFGAMLLFPLYYQTVRGASALSAGLLLAPQGLGAVLTMPIAGRMVDRIGPGRVVLTGLGLVLVGMLAFAQVAADSSYLLLGVALFVMGMGMGSTMMPAMSAAYQTLERAAIARATTALNIVMRVGGSIGTALLAVVLQHQLSGRLPAGSAGGIGAARNLPATLRAEVAPRLAEAFAHTFRWSIVLLALALLPALLLPRHKAPPPPTPDSPPSDTDPSVDAQLAVGA
ncbi:MAG: family efflux transporter permease subunit [Conexibacter sp.]|nr:family efflux transporter permease subunit [Conexibacter sp.]